MWREREASVLQEGWGWGLQLQLAKVTPLTPAFLPLGIEGRG